MTRAATLVAESTPPTPMMRQYLRIKAEAGAETLLLYRMGDFYEVFFEDAKVMAATLDIALTKRGKHDGQPIPMAGIPVHASETYIARLLEAGHCVAIAEVTEDPEVVRQRGLRRPARREIVRLIKPDADAPTPCNLTPAPLRSEPTEVGEQTLVHGVRPVTLGERLTALTHQPMRPRRNPAAEQKSCDHGLFDEVGRAQMDLCDLIDQLTQGDRP